ncbi:MAG: CBS domain-containing protein [Pseudomonadota bacterium]
MNVQHILGSKPPGTVVIAPSSAVMEAVELLSARRIGAVVVSEDGVRVEGILSERDIVRELGRRGTACLREPVSSLMTTKVVACEVRDSAVSVLERMTAGRFRHMPVMEGEAMIGVISIGDVVKARMTEMEQENASLTDLIKGY